MLLSDKQKSERNIQCELVNLWCDVFGDEEEYAKLILPYLDYFDCFALFENGSLVSALYLLPCEIINENKSYKGRYLYAAATKQSCRGNGYMAKLIREALGYCEEIVDFISLVPADEGLYGYYAKFGFETAMYRYATVFEVSDKVSNVSDLIFLSAEDVISFRKNKLRNAQHYSDISMKYATDCYSFYNSRFYGLKDDCVFLGNTEEGLITEFISGETNESLEEMLKCFSGKVTVYSPYAVSEKSLKEKCGMIYSFDSTLKENKEIYMNLTLG